jgi:hypothetical protein
LNLVFSGSDEPFSSPLLHYGVWDNFSPQKNNTQKNTPQSMNMKTKTHLKKTRLSLQLVPAVTILAALAISIPVSAQTITTFDLTRQAQARVPFRAPTPSTWTRLGRS